MTCNMKMGPDELKQVLAAIAKNQVTVYFMITDTLYMTVNDANVKHYSHLGADPGNQVTIKKLRPYSSFQDLIFVYNAQLNEKCNQSPETTELFFIRDELARTTDWLTCIEAVDRDFKYINVLRLYIELLYYKQNELIKAGTKQSNKFRKVLKDQNVIKLDAGIITHRESVLVNLYKFDAGLENRKLRLEHMQEGGNGRYKAFLSLTSNTLHPPLKHEIEKAIKLLEAFPKAKAIAQAELKKI